MIAYKVHGDCIHSSSAFPQQCMSENTVGYIKAILHGTWQNISLQPVCIYMKGEREVGLCLHCSAFIAYKAASQYHYWKYKNIEKLGELQLVDFCFLIRLFHGALLTARLIQTCASPKSFPFFLGSLPEPLHLATFNRAEQSHPDSGHSCLHSVF